MNLKLVLKPVLVALCCALLLDGLALTPQAQDSPFTRIDRDPARVILRYDPKTFDFHVAPPASYTARDSVKTATIIIDYLPAGSTDVAGSPCYAWPAEAKTAFRYAADVWETLVRSDVPIRIETCWTEFDEEGVLGYGGVMSWYGGPPSLSGYQVSPTVYPVSLVNAFTKSDVNDNDNTDSNGDGADADSEMFVAYSREFDWYFGTDGNTPEGQVDFASVVLHEICHGLGFTGRGAVDMNGTGYLGFLSSEGKIVPGVYDAYAKNGQGQSLFSLPNPSTEMGNQLQGEDVFFDGPNANAANGGTPPELFAPPVWMPGSSYSHLDESFNGTINALMTFALNAGESNHNPGPVAMGILKDLGWNYNYTPTLSIPDVTLLLNKSKTLDLWDYTSDQNDAPDTLSYSLVGTGGSTLLISGTARISGTHYLYIEPQSTEIVRDIEVQVMDPEGATDSSRFQVTFVEQLPMYLPFVIQN